MISNKMLSLWSGVLFIFALVHQSNAADQFVEGGYMDDLTLINCYGQIDWKPTPTWYAEGPGGINGKAEDATNTIFVDPTIDRPCYMRISIYSKIDENISGPILYMGFERQKAALTDAKRFDLPKSNAAWGSVKVPGLHQALLFNQNSTINTLAKQDGLKIICAPVIAGIANDAARAHATTMQPMKSKPATADGSTSTQTSGACCLPNHIPIEAAGKDINKRQLASTNTGTFLTTGAETMALKVLGNYMYFQINDMNSYIDVEGNFTRLYPVFGVLNKAFNATTGNDFIFAQAKANAPDSNGKASKVDNQLYFYYVDRMDDAEAAGKHTDQGFKNNGGAAPWTATKFYKDKPLAADCSSKKCPVTIYHAALSAATTDNDGVPQAWIAITLPAVSSSLMANKFYILAQQTDLTFAVDKSLGMTEIPAGSCSQDTACNLSVFAQIVGGLANNAIDHFTMLAVCPWPKFKCTSAITFAAGNKPWDELKTSTKIDGSNAIVKQINYAPNPSGDANEVLLHTENGKSAKLYLTMDSVDEQTFPILIQANTNSGVITADNANQDYRGWKYTGPKATAEFAGGTEYPAQGLNIALANAKDCDAKYGCAAYGSTYAATHMWVRTAWPHRWADTGFQYLAPNYDQYKVSEFSYTFSTPKRETTIANALSIAGLQGIVNVTNATVNNLPYVWRVYALTKKDTSGGHKLTFKNQTKINIHEYVATASGALMITRAQLDKAGTSTLAAETNWETGDKVRKLTATSNKGGADAQIGDGTFDYRPQYNFATAGHKRNIGLHLKDGSSTGNAATAGGPNLYLVNTARVSSRVKGSCSKPTWHDDAGVMFANAAAIALPVQKTIQANCVGLKDGGTAPKTCTIIPLTTGAYNSGVYEIWWADNTNAMPYAQTSETSKITIEPYNTENASYVDSTKINLNNAGKKTNPTFELEYNHSAAIKLTWDLGSTAVSPHNDHVGFILYKSYSDSINPPSSVKRTDVFKKKEVDYTTQALGYDNDSSDILRWIKSCTGNSAKNKSAGDTDIKACVLEHGTGTYFIYVQIVGSDKYTKQSGYIKVTHASTYAATGSNVVKGLKWKNAVLQTDPSGEGSYLFDDVERTVCDKYASKGEQKEVYYTNSQTGSTQTSMQLTMTGGADNLQTDDLCYLQLFKDTECKTVADTPNGVEPPQVGIVKDYMGNALSGDCQTGNKADVTPDKDTDNNFYQIPTVVAEQFGPGMCVQMWVRKKNKKWTKQANVKSKLVFPEYAESTGESDMITAFGTAKVADMKTKVGGDQIVYTVGVKESATNKNNNIPRICLKPVLTGTSNDFFIRHYNAKTSICNTDSEALKTGTGQTYTATFGSVTKPLYPGVYDIYSKYSDKPDSSTGISYCKKWSKQNIQATYAWTQDAGVGGKVSWGGEGISLEAGPTYTYAAAKIKKNLSKTSFLKWKGELSQELSLDITYSKQIVAAADHTIYWSKATGTDVCDCSKDRCTRLSNDLYPPNQKTIRIESDAPLWPSIGAPGCQHGKRTYTSQFPADGVYTLCVSKTVTYRGYEVQVAGTEGTNVNVTLSINPVDATAAPATTVKPVPASSSTLSSLFAIIAAVLGAFLL